jgi:hypothetical protein
MTGGACETVSDLCIVSKVEKIIKGPRYRFRDDVLCFVFCFCTQADPGAKRI